MALISSIALFLYFKLDDVNKSIFEKSDEIISLSNSISSLRIQLNEFQSGERKTYSFLPGCKALLVDYGLSLGKKSFKVNYEVEILEVTPNKLKVKAYNFTSYDAIGRDPSNKQAIIDFLKGHWVNKSSAQIILDDSHIREIKLNQML